MKNEENYKYTFWDKFLLKLNIGLWLFVVLIALIFGFVGHVNAMSEQSYFPFVQNNDNIPANVYGAVTSSYPLDDYYVFISSIGYSSWGNTNYPYFAISKQYSYPYATISQDGYHFSFYNGSSGYYGECRVQGNGNLTINSGLNISYNPYFQNLVSPLYDTSISYFMNFDLYTDSSEVVPVAYVNAPLVVPDSGHAQSPTGIPTFQHPIGMHPTQAPTVPTYTVPSPSNAPTFDINQPFQSLFDILDYWFNFVVDLITGLIQVIIDWWNFIGELILWIFDYYIDWLNMFLDWLYNIFKYLLEPVYNFLDNFFKFFFNEETQKSIVDLLISIDEKLDSLDSLPTSIWTWFNTNYVTPVLQKFDDIKTAIDNIRILFTADSQPSYLRTQFFNSYMGQFIIQVKRLLVGFMQMFDNIQTPDSLIFYVDFGDLPVGHYFRDVGVITIDFTWYAGIRTTIQTIFVTCLYVGVGYAIIFKLPGIINGAQGFEGAFGVTYTTTPYEGNDNVYFGQRRIGGPVAKGGKH